MKIITPTPGSYLKTFDTDEVITDTIAESLRRDGFEAAGVYIHVVTTEQLSALLSVGMGVFFITQGLGGGVVPDAAIGIRQGAGAIAKLGELGVPRGATVFSDIEQSRIPDLQHGPDAWVAYGNAHADTVANGGHIPGGYFGGGCGLTSHEMFDMRMVRYGKGAARILDRHGAYAEPSCGWSWVQGFPTDILHASGIKIDIGALWGDYRQARMVSLVVA